MNDISQYFGNDIDVSPTGDLLVANSTVTGEQRVYRRLLTNPALDDRNGNPIASADYTFHPDYGAGIPRKIGRPADIDGTQSLIQAQMFKEAAVATSPAPNISVSLDGNLMSTVVRYIDAQSKEPVVLAFDIGQ